MNCIITSPDYLGLLGPDRPACRPSLFETAHWCWNLPALNAARQRWATANVSNYSFVLEDSAGAAYFDLPGSVEMLFERVANSLQPREPARVRFDETLGYPHLLDTDPPKRFNVTDFEISHAPSACPSADPGDRENVPLDGLVGFWRFNDCQDPNVQDASTHGNHGTVRFGQLARTGGPWRPGLRGGALELNDAVVQVEAHASIDALATSNAFSVFMWVRTEDHSSQLVGRWDAQNNRPLFSLGMQTSYPTCVMGGKTKFGNAKIPYQVWAHVGMVFDGKTCTLFLNGQPIGESDVEMSWSAQNTPLMLGGFKGRLDDAVMYSRALDVGEIAALAFRSFR